MIEFLPTELKDSLLLTQEESGDCSYFEHLFRSDITPLECFQNLEIKYGEYIDEIYQRFLKSKSILVKQNPSFIDWFQKNPIYYSGWTEINQNMKKYIQKEEKEPLLILSKLKHGKRFTVVGCDFAGGTTEWPLHKMEIEIVPAFGEITGHVEYVDPHQICPFKGTFNQETDEVMWRIWWFNRNGTKFAYQYDGKLTNGKLIGTYRGLCENKNNGFFSYKLISIEEPISKSQLFIMLKKTQFEDFHFLFI